MSLNKEEEILLETFTDPDLINKDKYAFSQEVQKEIISLLLNDNYFIIQSLDLIKPSYFSNESHQLCARVVFNYFRKYKTTPSKSQLFQELEDLLRSKDVKSKVSFLGEINSIYDYYLPRSDAKQYYLDKITNFAKSMAIKIAFSKSLEELEKNGDNSEIWSKVHDILQQAMSIERNIDIGLDYFQTYQERYERAQQKVNIGDVFITGFKEIDDSITGGGLTRGEIGSFIGISGSGKSLALVKASLENLHRGKKILYISLEIDQDKVAERFDAQLANPDPYSNSNGISTNNLLQNKDVVFKSLENYISEKEDKRLLVIKQFPAGQMDVSTMRAYFSQLKTEGFNADLVIVDYVGEMKDYPGMPTWESRQKIVRDLRGFATEENVCIFTAMQPDKRAKEVIKLGGVIDDDNLADSYGQVRPLDCLWSLNQIQSEKECGLARLFVIKHRFGKSRFTIYVQFDYTTLCIKQISQNKYRSILQEYESGKKITAAEETALAEQAKAKMENFKKATKDKKDSKSTIESFKFSDIGYDAEAVAEIMENNQQTR